MNWEIGAGIVGGVLVLLALFSRLREGRTLAGTPQVPKPAKSAKPSGAAPTLETDDLARIEAALARGEKIEAIKLLREATRLGLSEAKDAVERMMAERGQV